MRGSRWALLALVALATAACQIGGNLDRVRSARSPNGARATLHFRTGNPRTVELLTQSDSVLLVMHGDSVKTVDWDRLSRIRIDGLDQYLPPFSARERAEILRVSRFPYGASADVMAAVLSNSGQSAPAVLE